MSHRVFWLSVRLYLVAVLLQVPSIVTAGQNANARILLHLTAPTSKNACLSGTNIPDCFEIDTSGQLQTDYFAYVILSNVSSALGIGALKLGITYNGAASNGVDIASWTSCGASLEFPYGGWPGAGSGIRLIWTTPACSTTVVGQYAMFLAGYFQLRAYSPDELSVTPHPLDNQASITDCGNVSEDILQNNVVLPLGWDVFSAGGAAEGSNPCGFWSGSCHISGPDSVGVNQAGIQYVMKAEEVTPQGFWSVSGNAQITSSNNSMATVNPTAPGTFSILYERTFGCVEGCGCGRQVKVLDTTPVNATTWGRIKTVYARH